MEQPIYGAQAVKAPVSGPVGSPEQAGGHLERWLRARAKGTLANSWLKRRALLRPCWRAARRAGRPLGAVARARAPVVSSKQT
eukprot:scaffold123481_cov36-Phaeocystis_antarctica.AAC.1